MEVSDPNWLKFKEGVDFVLKSFKGILDLEIKCVNSNKIKIAFKSPHVKDKGGKNFPFILIIIRLQLMMGVFWIEVNLFGIMNPYFLKEILAIPNS